MNYQIDSSTASNLKIVVSAAGDELGSVKSIFHQYLNRTHPFTFDGWAWALILFLLYPVRHFITRIFEGISLRLEYICIQHNWLWMKSAKIHGITLRPWGGSANQFAVEGVVVLINLLSTGNVINSVALQVNGTDNFLRWDPPDASPSTLSAREAKTFRFHTSDIPYPTNSSLIEARFIVKDMFGRAYEHTIAYEAPKRP